MPEIIGAVIVSNPYAVCFPKRGLCRCIFVLSFEVSRDDEFFSLFEYGVAVAAMGRTARFGARLVPEGLRIMRIGCGRMNVEQVFRPARYVSVDMVSRDERTTVVDLDSALLPDGLLGDIDLVTMFGVMEYIGDPDAVFRTIAAASVLFLQSYCAVDLHSNMDRRGSDLEFSALRMKTYDTGPVFAYVQLCGVTK